MDRSTILSSLEELLLCKNRATMEAHRATILVARLKEI